MIVILHIFRVFLTTCDQIHKVIARLKMRSVLPVTNFTLPNILSVKSPGKMVTELSCFFCSYWSGKKIRMRKGFKLLIQKLLPCGKNNWYSSDSKHDFWIQISQKRFTSGIGNNEQNMPRIFRWIQKCNEQQYCHLK